MSAPAPQSEKAFTEAVLEYGRFNGWLCCHFADSRRQVRPGVFVGDKDSAGFPDIVATNGKRLVFAELKVGKNKPSAKQQEWLNTLWELAGSSPEVECYVWYDTDWPEIEKVLRRSREVSGAPWWAKSREEA